MTQTSKIYRIDAGAMSDSHGSPGMEWINRPLGVLPAGPRPDLGNDAQGIGSGFGWEMPIYLLDGNLGRLPLADVEAEGRSLWLISDRAKLFLEQADPEAFIFQRVATRHRTSSGELDGQDYWLCDVVRFIEALDPEKSHVTQLKSGAKRIQPYSPMPMQWHFLPAARDFACFREMHGPSKILCSERLVHEIEKRELTGFYYSLAGEVP